MSLHKAVDPDDWLRAIKKKQLKNPSVTISIEDIMQQTCGDGKDSKPPKQKLRPTSPRSLQACLQLGIHPAELEWKPASCFEETGDGGTEAAEVKQKFYNKLRMVWCYKYKSTEVSMEYCAIKTTFNRRHASKFFAAQEPVNFDFSY